MSETKEKGVIETPEQKEIRELREANAILKKSVEDKDKDIADLVGETLPDVKGGFPGNISVLRLLFDEHKIPTYYEEIEVPEHVANEQLAKPKSERVKPYKEICYKEQADERFLR